MADLVHSESSIKRVLGTYLPPTMVELVLAGLRGHVEEERTVPPPTEEHRRRARAKLRELGHG